MKMKTSNSSVVKNKMPMDKLYLLARTGETEEAKKQSIAFMSNLKTSSGKKRYEMPLFPELEE